MQLRLQIFFNLFNYRENITLIKDAFHFSLLCYYHRPGLFPTVQFITEKNLRELFIEVKPIKMDNSDI